MRAYEILKEYSDVKVVQKELTQTIQGLNPDDEEHIKLIDRIYKILNKTHISDAIDRSLSTPLDDENLPPKTKKSVIRDVAEIIFGLESNVQNTHNMLDKLEKGGLVDVKELMEPVNSFESIFNGNHTAIELFLALKNYGQGKVQKGPGEWALAIMSNQVKLSTKGDIEVKGVGIVEVKASAESGNGGRIGHGGASRDAIMSVIEKYADKIPSVNKKIQLGAKGLGLNEFVAMMNDDLPISQNENIKIRKEIARNIFEKQFGSHSKDIINSFGQEDYSIILENYLKSNWEWYLDMAYFDALLFIGFANQKTLCIRSYKDLMELSRSKQLGAFNIRVIPSQAGPREAFAQLSMLKTKG